MNNTNYKIRQQEALKAGEIFKKNEENKQKKIEKEFKEKREKIKQKEKEKEQLKKLLKKLVIDKHQQKSKNIKEIEQDMMLIFENSTRYKFLRIETYKTTRRNIAKYISKQCKLQAENLSDEKMEKILNEIFIKIEKKE